MPKTKEDVREVSLFNDWVSKAFRDMWGGAMLPGDVYAGRVDPTSDEGIKRAADLAGMGFTGGMARASASPTAEASLGMFGGRGAKTADLEALAEAKRAVKKVDMPTPKNPSGGAGWREQIQDIREKTGWFQGPDGKWRFEIPDESATINAAPEFSGYLAELVSHPELFKAYPHLQDVPVRLRAGAAEGSDVTLGRASLPQFGLPGEINLFQTGAQSQDDRLSTVLHEVQHLLQGKEKFDTGAGRGASDEDYWRSLGEVEARDVMDRLRFSPDERRYVPPAASAGASTAAESRAWKAFLRSVQEGGAL